jgi:hypothetical protein
MSGKCSKCQDLKYKSSWSLNQRFRGITQITQIRLYLKSWELEVYKKTDGSCVTNLGLLSYK